MVAQVLELVQERGVGWVHLAAQPTLEPVGALLPARVVLDHRWLGPPALLARKALGRHCSVVNGCLGQPTLQVASEAKSLKEKSTSLSHSLRDTGRRSRSRAIAGRSALLRQRLNRGDAVAQQRPEDPRALPTRPNVVQADVPIVQLDKTPLVPLFDS